MIESSTQRLLIDVGSAGIRLDLFLADHFKPAKGSQRGLSRSEIQRLISEGQITLNGSATKASARIKSNDQINIRLLPPRDATIGSEELPLEILYEDADCIVINKAPGVTVHPAAGHWTGTLVNALLHHCPDLEGIGGVRRPGIVHRLDKDTSGVMIAAKNMLAYENLVLQFKNCRTKESSTGPSDGIVRIGRRCRAFTFPSARVKLKPSGRSSSGSCLAGHLCVLP